MHPTVSSRNTASPYESPSILSSEFSPRPRSSPVNREARRLVTLEALTASWSLCCPRSRGRGRGELWAHGCPSGRPASSGDSGQVQLGTHTSGIFTASPPGTATPSLLPSWSCSWDHSSCLPDGGSHPSALRQPGGPRLPMTAFLTEISSPAGIYTDPSFGPAIENIPPGTRGAAALSGQGFPLWPQAAPAGSTARGHPQPPPCCTRPAAASSGLRPAQLSPWRPLKAQTAPPAQTPGYI